MRGLSTPEVARRTLAPRTSEVPSLRRRLRELRVQRAGFYHFLFDSAGFGALSGTIVGKVTGVSDRGACVRIFRVK